MNYTDIGRQFGLDEAQTQAAFEALAPVIAAGMRRNATAGGLTDIIEALQRGGGGSASATDFGNVVLGEIFGSKDVSRGVAQQLSAQSGIGAAVLKQLLPIVASIVIGQVAKKALGGGGGGGGLADILGNILGGGSQPAPRQASSGGGLGDILGEILGGGAGRQTRQAPRGQTGPTLEDILGDLMGGGGGATRQQAPQQMPGGFEDILRDIFGGGMGGGAPANDGTPQPRVQQRRSADAADDLLNSVEQAVRRR
jgi:hypothetical protein